MTAAQSSTNGIRTLTIASRQVFKEPPDSRLGRLKVSLHTEIFRRFYRLRSMRSADYRAALAPVSGKTVSSVRIAMPQEWFGVFYNVPRFSRVYALSVGWDRAWRRVYVGLGHTAGIRACDGD
jgi:hypothetical protein